MSRGLIDWIGATWRETELLPIVMVPAGEVGAADLKTVAQSTKFIEDDVVPDGGYMGYTDSLTDKNGVRLYWAKGRPDMGVHISWPGRSLVSAGGAWGRDCLRWVARWGGRVSRLDVALDVNFVVDVRKIKHEFEEGRAITNVRKTPAILESDGTTLYVGSRKSEKFLRIYDKAAEQKTTGVTWWRGELETRGSAAVQLAASIVKNGIKVIPGYIKGYFHVPNNPSWKRLIGENVDSREIESARKRTNTVDWLMSTVAQTLARETEKDGELLENFLCEVEKHKRKLAEENGIE